MNPREFFINPADYGLSTRDELVAYRIWDNHFHGFAAANPIEQYERNNYFVERMGIERSIAQEVGGTLEEPFAPYPFDADILRILEHFPGSSPGKDLAELMLEENTYREISSLEGNGAVGRMIGAIPSLPSARVPVDRIVFGSHAPYFPVETALLKLVESPLNANDIQAIMQANARRLLPRA